MLRDDRTGEGALSGAPAFRPGLSVRAKAIVFAAVALAVLLIDRLTKMHFDAYPLGFVADGPLPSVFDFALVHNTGAAWGMFGNSTQALGIVSVLFSLVFAGILFGYLKDATKPETLGLSLIVAGGIGNGIDRFAQGYVTDFLHVTFFDFPVFNVADIAVTCGFVIAVIGLFAAGRFSENGGARDVRP